MRPPPVSKVGRWHNESEDGESIRLYQECGFVQTQTLNFRPSLVPPKIKVIRTVDGKNRARIHTEFLELVTVHGSYHLIVGRYNIPSDVDRDIDSHVIEVEREVLADITIPAPTLERVVVEMAAAVAEAKRRRSEIDGDNPQDPRE